MYFPQISVLTDFWLSTDNLHVQPKFIYSSSLIIRGKYLFVKAKVKTIMQHNNNLAACFKNKLNFLKWRSNDLKSLDKKTKPHELFDLLNAFFHVGPCQGVHVQSHASNNQACIVQLNKKTNLIFINI